MKAEKRVLVSGISGGIGQAIGRRLVQSGYSLVGLGHRKKPAVEYSYEYIAGDFDDPPALECVLKSRMDLLKDLSAVVSCAGRGKFASLEELSVAEIQSTMNVNLLGHMVLAKICVPLMKRQKKGDLIFIGSEAALQGARKGTAYCASKFALRGFAQSLSAECSNSNVRVCLINPGMVRTPFFDSLDFRPGDAAENAIEAIDIAEIVEQLLKNRQGTVVDEINLSPRKKVIAFG